MTDTPKTIPIDTNVPFTSNNGFVHTYPQILNMSQIEPMPINWLWEPYFAFNKITTLAGPKGAAKSLITHWLMATISVGGKLPDGTNCPQGHCIFYSIEDTLEDVIAPRLQAMGANPEYIHPVTAFDPSTDITRLQNLLSLILTETHGRPPLLFVIDPILDLVSGDMNKSNLVRQALRPLATWMDQHKFATCGITHFNKFSKGSDPTERILGAGAFAHVPRILLYAAKDKVNQGRRVFLRGATNIAGEVEAGYEYWVEPVVIKNKFGMYIKTAKLCWGEALKGSTEEILAQCEGVTEQESSKKNIARLYILKKLSKEPCKAETIIRELEELGINKRTTQRAREEEGLKPYLQNGEWWWSLTSIER